jgi:hypothetical protein
MAYVLKLRNRRTGERFTSQRFESFEAAANYGERLDAREWDWSIDQA